MDYTYEQNYTLLSIIRVVVITSGTSYTGGRLNKRMYNIYDNNKS